MERVDPMSANVIHARQIGLLRASSPRCAVSDGWRRCCYAVLLILSGQMGWAAADETVQPEPEATNFATQVAPFLANYCVDCHSGSAAEGGIDLEHYQDSANIQADYELWETVVRLINERQMPPADEEQPTADEIEAAIAGLDVEFATFDCTTEQHPGSVTIRRLNKAEYDNTIRDLVGLNLNLADDFPSDDVGNGFDNISDVLSIPPILLEKYLTASAKVADAVMDDAQVRLRVFPHQSTSDEDKAEVARRNIVEFAEKAFRRPVSSTEEDRLFEIVIFAWQRDVSEVDIYKTVISAILSNPNFLFRVEQDPDVESGQRIRQLNSYELASRLSYFLWSSMPDEELFALAASDALTDEAVLVAQAQRMLLDPKARALVDNFAGQWLQLRDVATLSPDPDAFPEFDSGLRSAMRRETEEFVASLIREDRSVLDFLGADYTYVNQRLAEHYGIEGVQGDEFRRIKLASGRRGILTHASILTLTSNPTRTSPVKRGKWVLDNILAEPPPPPPPGVPELAEGGETLGTLREQMEQHRADPNCAACHRTMDALGFGLENFDATGAWREQDGKFTIDASGGLPGGRNFSSPADLMQVLVEEKSEQFCRCLSEKLLTYALGRGLSSYDRCTIQKSLDELQANEYRFSSLVKTIVTSDPFTMREAK